LGYIGKAKCRFDMADARHRVLKPVMAELGALNILEQVTHFVELGRG
jgi:hypothetical protein